jgi:hypothetical protein
MLTDHVGQACGRGTGSVPSSTWWPQGLGQWPWARWYYCWQPAAGPSPGFSLTVVKKPRLAEGKKQRLTRQRLTPDQNQRLMPVKKRRLTPVKMQRRHRPPCSS